MTIANKSACESLWRFFNSREQKELFFGEKSHQYRDTYPFIFGFLATFIGRGSCWAEIESWALDFQTTPSGVRQDSYGFTYFLSQKLSSPKWSEESRFAELKSFSYALRHSAIGGTSMFPQFIAELKAFEKAHPQCAPAIQSFLQTPFQRECLLRLMFPNITEGISIENAAQEIADFCKLVAEQKKAERQAAEKAQADRQAALLNLQQYLREKFAPLDLKQFKDLGASIIEEEIRKELARKLGLRYGSGMFF